MKHSCLIGLLVLAACASPRDGAESMRAPPASVSSSPASPSRDAGGGPREPVEPDERAAVAAAVAHVFCDFEKRFISASARGYASYEECLALRTGPRTCTLAQARTCARFAASLEPGVPGAGLTDDPDCRACLRDAGAADRLAEERAALDHAKLIVYSAMIASGPWPEELKPLRSPSSIVLKVDVALTDFGYRIDPDDFLLVVQESGAAKVVAQDPFAERLTPSGKPITWTDPSVMRDPDLRMVAYFVVPDALRGASFSISYNGKTSEPFTAK